MPRAPYDNVATVRWGPAWPNAGLVRFVVPCRLVENNRQASQAPTDIIESRYVNWSGPLSIAGVSSILLNVITLDLNYADIWEFASAPGQFHTVIRTAVIRPLKLGNPIYRRAWFAI